LQECLDVVGIASLSLSTSVRPNDGQHPAAGIVIGAMASTCVEKHESLVVQDSLHLGKPDAARRPSHLLDQFLPAAHESSSGSSGSSPLGVGVATPSS